MSRRNTQLAIPRNFHVSNTTPRRPRSGPTRNRLNASLQRAQYDHHALASNNKINRELPVTFSRDGIHLSLVKFYYFSCTRRSPPPPQFTTAQQRLTRQPDTIPTPFRNLGKLNHKTAASTVASSLQSPEAFPGGNN